MVNLKKTILVVEDEQILNRVICSKLQEYGAQTVSARSVQQALEYIDLMPDISAIWMDHYLLGKDDGLVLVAKVKSDNSDKKHMPIFVVSNTASDSKMRAYINLGIDKYFVKSNAKLESIALDLCTLIEAKNTDQPKQVSVPTPTPAQAPTPTPTQMPEQKPKIAINTPVHTGTTVPQKKLIKVLIAEDELTLRGLLTSKFEKTGRYEVLGAQDGEEALDIVMTQKVDVIVLDMEMPNLDGEGFLKKLNEHYTETLPYIIVLTNTQSMSKMADVMQYGVLDYLIKSDHSLSAVVDAVDKRIAGGAI